MKSMAVIFEAPERLAVSPVVLPSPGDEDVVVDIDWSGISTGTERLLWSGRMPPFPGMGYPLIPGYESIGRITDAGLKVQERVGEHVFVPGARCFGEIRGLFGGAASRVVIPSGRATKIDGSLGEAGVLMALAATAYHALTQSLPELIVGHGVLGRLLARLTMALGGEPPVVWETNPGRCGGARGYAVLDPASDERHDYRVIHEVSGDSEVLDTLVARIAKGGEIVLAGFYSERLAFTFPPAFMREARFRIAAEWRPEDMAAVADLVAKGTLSLDGLITHRLDIEHAED
ncbi:MAG: chlorophyll synthesis pathway protein BchC, partial [Pseudomonadota bacterium]